MKLAKIKLISMGCFIGLMVSMGAISILDHNSQENSDQALSRLAKLSHHQRNLSWMCEQDNTRARLVLLANLGPLSTSRAISEFALTVLAPLRMSCVSMIAFGGHFFDARCLDGHKYVCLDDFADPQEECLIYSFGIANDIGFEEAMTKLGCQVFGYDSALTTVMKNNKNPDITLEVAKIGPSSATEVSLLDVLRANQHLEVPIRYLKVDIEGAERAGLKEWIKSGALTNVQQLGVEFHDVEKNVIEYWEILQGLYKLGFKLISFDSNHCSPKDSLLHQCIELVFRQTQVCSAYSH